MKKVFIGGSRRLARLNDQIRSKLAEIVERQLHVVVGDANGADRAVQALLAEWRYANVTVYYVGLRPRNNEGGWPLEHVPTPEHSKGFDFYAAKDKRMAADADCGLMIWDGRSRGTLANLANLVDDSKPVSLYVSQRRRFVNVLTPDDLAAVIANAEAASPGDDQSELPLKVPRRSTRGRARRTA